MFAKHAWTQEQSTIIFWLGVLTGALIVAIVFLYATFKAQHLENALLKGLGTTNFIQDQGD